jgi:hypothetical protein
MNAAMGSLWEGRKALLTTTDRARHRDTASDAFPILRSTRF